MDITKAQTKHITSPNKKIPPSDFLTRGDFAMGLVRIHKKLGDTHMARTIKGIVDSTSYSWLTYYGNTAQKKVPDTAKCDIINLWINR